MKKITCLLFLTVFVGFSQQEKSQKIGQVTKDELKMTLYEKDSTANAVVLYEHANVYIDPKNKFQFRTDYYFRIKLFNKESFDLADIEIPFYKKEKLLEIKAVTYNLEEDFIKKKFVGDSKIFTTQRNESWKETKFTLPNLKNGSVIEYVYSVLSPYPQIDDWNFQSSIPKIKSEFDIAILGNYKYNIRVIGFKALDKSDSSIKKGCLYIPGIGNGNCLLSSFGMNNVPAFKEEDYMLNKKNFMSRLVFDLISYTAVDGSKTNYTKTWKNADRTLRVFLLDKQTSKKNYFKKNLPKDILTIENELDKAKKVYSHIQEKLNWNEKYWTREDLKIKKVYEEGSGSVDAINLILYNSLQAANIESYLVALSTRNNGLPTKLFPVVNDFNYILVKVIINGESFFVDASNKNLAFGQIPFKCINGDGRVLDFKKGSYWEELKSSIKSIINTRVKLEFNESNNLIGNIDVTKKGYFASDEREKLSDINEEEYLDNFESENTSLEVDDYLSTNLENNNIKLKQSFKVLIENDNDNNIINFNPFFYGKISTNPFKLNERYYPVDYGYKRSFTYNLKIEMPEKYEVLNLPKEKTLALPNKGGIIIFKCNYKDNAINIYLKYSVNKKIYSKDEYHYLKEFYNQLIQIQNGTIKLKTL
ncbi:hypothetical protein LPB136_08025 [Tenacibaculum todarodis]|uniref:DUF3857 domain-containing protein n=1 Tax=Tenacibaculum todarodis TaxID=1850252 RepID=A0A1L3JMY9_9FLAO|nr:hypothetical protein LPB136_08025 [Tenacibaculum todarodis]